MSNNNEPRVLTIRLLRDSDRLLVQRVMSELDVNIATKAILRACRRFLELSHRVSEVERKLAEVERERDLLLRELNFQNKQMQLPVE